MDDFDQDIGITKAAPDLLSSLDVAFVNLLSVNTSENEVSEIKQLLEPFQASPQLIDSRLPTLVTELTEKYRKSKEAGICEVLYVLCKVRGFKVVSRFMASDAALLENIVTDLERRPETWHERYVLLLWLAVLVLIPFDFEIFGSGFKIRVYDVVTPFLAVPGKERDAAALVLARLVSRPDCATSLLPQFMKYSECVERKETKSFEQIGVLQALANLWRVAGWQEIHLFAERMIQLANNAQVESAVAHKLISKILGRVAVALLNASINQEDIPESVEDILAHLLESLAHQETLVRYTTAKAIARIVHKLNEEELQIQVMEEVLDIFSQSIVRIRGAPSLQHVSSNRWHGGLLCIAEFLRRNLVKETQFSKLTQILIQSLTFEQKRLTTALGANVRDASCYVCWAFFRSYSSIPIHIMTQLLESLVGLSCLDREVNIRRAASAAIQEGVGRQGDPVSIKRGLELIQLVDYFNIGRRSRSFLEVSKQVYALGFQNILSDLLLKVDSWDPEVRWLTARAIGNLSEFNCQYATSLLDMYTVLNFEMQHGVMLALGELQLLQANEVERCLDILEGLTERQLTEENDVYHAEGFMHLFVALYIRENSGDATRERLRHLLTTSAVLAMQVPSEHVEHDAQKLAHLMADEDILNIWISKMNEGANNFTFVLGAVSTPPQFLVSALVEAAAGRSLRGSDVSIDTRKQALISLGSILMTRTSISESEEAVILAGLNDYTIETGRGDVGSWMRHAAIDCTVKVHKTASQPFLLEATKSLLRISAEVLDRLRYHAASAISEICPSRISSITKRLPDGSDRDPKVYFETIVCLFDVLTDEEHVRFLIGYVGSAGALQASSSTMVASQEALVRHLINSSAEKQVSFFKRIAKLINVKAHGSKTTTCALRALHVTLQYNNELASAIRAPNMLRALYVQVYNAQINTSNVQRLLEAVEVFSVLSELHQKDSLIQLTRMCANQYYPVRSRASECLYQTLTEYENDDILELVGDVDWQDLKMARKAVDELMTMIKRI